MSNADIKHLSVQQRLDYHFFLPQVQKYSIKSTDFNCLLFDKQTISFHIAPKYDKDK